MRTNMCLPFHRYIPCKPGDREQLPMYCKPSDQLLMPAKQSQCDNLTGAKKQDIKLILATLTVY